MTRRLAVWTVSAAMLSVGAFGEIACDYSSNPSSATDNHNSNANSAPDGVNPGGNGSTSSSSGNSPNDDPNSDAGSNDPSSDGSTSEACPRAITATPTFSPAPGVFATAQDVVLSSANPTAIIFYTTDGTNPITTGAVYTGPITISSTTEIRVLATAMGCTPSDIGTGKFIIQP